MSSYSPTLAPRPVSLGNGALRLTRRGRLVVLALALAVLLAIGIAFAQGSVATSEARQTETIVVVPGDTLWDIASERAEDGDVTAMMHFLKELNHLDSPALAAGQRLIVPVD